MPRELALDPEIDGVFLELDGDEANAVEDYLELLEFDPESAAAVAQLVRKLLTATGMMA